MLEYLRLHRGRKGAQPKQEEAEDHTVHMANVVAIEEFTATK